jgi:hypothetical protein
MHSFDEVPHPIQSSDPLCPHCGTKLGHFLTGEVFEFQMGPCPNPRCNQIVPKPVLLDDCEYDHYS